MFNEEEHLLPQAAALGCQTLSAELPMTLDLLSCLVREVFK